MKKTTEFLGGCAMTLSYTAFLCWMFSMTRLHNECTFMALNPAVFVVFYLALYVLDLLMVKKELNLALYVGFQLIMAAGSVGLFLLFSEMEPFSTGTVIFMGIFTTGGVFACAYGAEDPVGPKNLIFYFDSIVVLMIVMLLVHHLVTLYLVVPTLTLCFLSMGLNMLALIRARTLREGSNHQVNAFAAGRLVMIVAVAVLLIVSALLVIFAASGTESLSHAIFSGVKWAGNSLSQAGIFLMKKLEEFLIWFIQFLPDFEYDGTGEVPPAFFGDGNHTGANVVIPRYFFYIAAALFLLWLIRFLLSMRKEKMGTAPTPAAPNTEAKRSGTLLSGLKSLIRDIRTWLRFKIDCIRLRNTPPGLLLWCENHVPKSMVRDSGESGPEFLRRLSGCNLNQEQQQAILELSRLTAQCFYAPGSASVSKALCKTIKSCKFH